MAVAVANPLLLTDGDAAFIRVDNRRPAHGLPPGVVADATNKRFEDGRACPRYGVALDIWGQPWANLVSGVWPSADPTTGLLSFEVTGFTVGKIYQINLGNADSLSATEFETDPANFISARTGIARLFLAGQTNYFLTSANPGATTLVGKKITTRIGRTMGLTCAYARFNDPTTNTDNGILITDEWRDGAGEDGGRGRAWRIQSGNAPQQIFLNGHDVWQRCFLEQAHNAMILARADGKERHYFTAADINANADTIQIHCAPSWGQGAANAKRVRYELASAQANIPGNSAPAAGNYYFAKYTLSGSAHLIELYSDSGCANKMVFDTGIAGKFYVELGTDPEPWFGNGAPPLILQANATNNAFDLGFVAVTNNVAVTSTSAGTGIISAANHRLIPGDAVALTLSTDTIVTKYVAPRSEHTFVIYDTLAEALADPGTTVGITDTALGTDILTATAHGLATQEAVTLSDGIGGVTAATTYYVNRIGADTFYLYDTAANALTGGATGRANLTTDDQTATLFRNGQVGLTAGQTGSVKKTTASGLAIPPLRRIRYLNGRLWGIVNKDTIVQSDPFDFLHYTLYVSTVSANQGEAGQANWLSPLGEDVMLIGKEQKVIALSGISGPVSGWREGTITEEFGGNAPLAALNVGSDVWLLSRKGVCSIVRTIAGQRLAIVRTVSYDIPTYLREIDWAAAAGACAAVWNNRLLLAVPNKGQDPVSRNDLDPDGLPSDPPVYQDLIMGAGGELLMGAGGENFLS